MIKNFSDTTKEQLLNLYNYIWTKRLFPDCWREVIIIPILKPEKNPSEPSSYHRTFQHQKIVNKILKWHLENNQLLTNAQCGFRNGRSTINQFFSLQTEINNVFENGQHLVVIFFDIDKAYETTWRHYILKTLVEYNIKGNMIHFVIQFRTKFNGYLSDEKTQMNGVP